MTKVDEPVVWRIRLHGHVERNWAEWFTWLDVNREKCANGTWQTVLEGELRDMAALHGLITRMCDMNISVLSLELVDSPAEKKDS